MAKLKSEAQVMLGNKKYIYIYLYIYIYIYIYINIHIDVYMELSIVEYIVWYTTSRRKYIGFNYVPIVYTYIYMYIVD